MATGIRDTLCNLKPLGIPRPTINGLKFIPTKGRMGFYKTIKQEGEKFGVSIKNQGPRRPALPGADFWRQQTGNDNDEKKVNEIKDSEKDIKENNNNDKAKNLNHNNDESSDILGELKSVNRNSLKDFNYNRNQHLTQIFAKMPIIEEGSTLPPEVPEPDYDEEDEEDNNDNQINKKEEYPKTIISPVHKFMERHNIINKFNPIRNNDNKYNNYHDKSHYNNNNGNRNQGLPPLPRNHYWNNGNHFNYQQNTLVQKL
uniref:Homeobox protein 2-like n=1 Tax=Parastrongyloides trichosuri TaxID=131310 RepID=A0A0N4ZR25_PARTI